jgi:hypothetical protein
MYAKVASVMCIAYAAAWHTRPTTAATTARGEIAKKSGV